MKLLHPLQVRFAGREAEALALVRMFLGFALLTRGILLIADPSGITRLAGASGFYWWTSFIIVAHTGGGLLLTVGLWTRLAALLQIPILLGAVLIVHRSEGLLTHGQSLEISVLVLLLLTVFFVFGPGAWSVDGRRAAAG